MRYPVYVIHAFPERREALEFELREHGKVPLESVRWVDAPRGVEVRSEKLHACRRWRDPHAKRLLTWGELACFAGHRTAWSRIAGDSAPGGFVLQDDARILAPLAEAPLRGGLAYLGGKFLDEPGDPVAGLLRAPYTYWAIGYWLSREAAARLADSVNPQAVLPADEYVPFHCGRNPNVDAVRYEQKPPLGLDAWALPEWIVEPSGRFGSGTEESASCFTLDTYVFATDAARAAESLAAYRELGYRPRVLGAGEPGWDTSGPAGIDKLRWLREELENGDLDHSVVLAADGYDTLPVVHADELLKRFAEMAADLVISGERTCRPDVSLALDLDRFHAASPLPEAPYRYPNAGLFAGFAADLRCVLRAGADSATKYDQLYLQRRMLDDGIAGDDRRWRVDGEAYLFQSIARSEDDIERRGGRPFNHATQCYPAIVLTNGESEMDLARPLAYREPKLAEGMGEWMEVADGIVAMPFLDPAGLEMLLAMAAAVPGLWQLLPGDKVPGDELRIKRLDSKLWDGLTTALRDHLAPVINARWRPAQWKDPSDAFLIRYSTERQPTIRLHEDISYFSCSIRLRKACAGGELQFPRQNFADSLVPDGWLLCWPSRITHPHQVRPVRKGARVSLVVWTPER